MEASWVCFLGKHLSCLVKREYPTGLVTCPELDFGWWAVLPQSKFRFHVSFFVCLLFLQAKSWLTLQI